MRSASVRVGTLVGIALAAAALLGAKPARRSPLAVAIPNPILFVTQVPVPGDFTTVASVFGNATGGLEAAPRGGDLWIQLSGRHAQEPDAARGVRAWRARRTAHGIAVREPSVHWSGTKAVFTMVIGAPTAQYVQGTYFWQIYEVTGLGRGRDAGRSRRCRTSPPGFNNVAPLYGTDERILFTSDRPRNGAAHLYPQLDEYEEAPTVTGLWSLDPVDGRPPDAEPLAVGRLLADDRLLRARRLHAVGSPAARPAGRRRRPGRPLRPGESVRHVQLRGRVGRGRAPRTRGPRSFPSRAPRRTDLLAGTNLVGHSPATTSSRGRSTRTAPRRRR